MNTTAKKEAIGDPDTAYLKVYPRNAGNFGNISISSICWDDTNHLDNMADQIKRHVDDFGHSEIAYDGWLCPVCRCCYWEKNEAENCECDKE